MKKNCPQKKTIKIWECHAIAFVVVLLDLLFAYEGVPEFEFFYIESRYN